MSDNQKTPAERFLEQTQYDSVYNRLGDHQSIEPFLEDFNSCSIIIAHNMQFDKNVLGAEMMRYGRVAQKKAYTWLCTMQASTDYCKLPGKYGSYKWPQLMEVYVKLFGKEFEGAHDALDDVKACAQVLFELIRIGVITLPEPL